MDFDKFQAQVVQNINFITAELIRLQGIMMITSLRIGSKAQGHEELAELAIRELESIVEAIRKAGKSLMESGVKQEAGFTLPADPGTMM